MLEAKTWASASQLVAWSWYDTTICAHKNNLIILVQIKINFNIKLNLTIKS